MFGVRHPKLARPILQAQVSFFEHLGHGVGGRENLDYDVGCAAEIPLQILLRPAAVRHPRNVRATILPVG
jgi:hypothetical protein